MAQQSDLPTDKYRMVKRSEWCADSPKAIHPLTLPSLSVLFGFTFTKVCYDVDQCCRVVKNIQQRNIIKYQLADIRYNFLIDGRGNIYIGRGWRIRANLPKKYTYLSGRAIYVGMIGTPESCMPNYCVMAAREKLVKFGVSHEYLSPKHLQFNI